MTVRTARILIVEDELVIAKDLQKQLQKLGHDIPEIAASGEKAISIASKINPELVLMDIVLKGEMDGVKTAERLRSQFDIPVVFLTAYGDDQTLQRAKVSEPFGYILKPFDMQMVKITIEIALYKHEVERERAKLVAELRQALEHVKTLRGLLPICAWCKKIRNDKGYWEEVEEYIQRHTEADFSHGICPDCAEKYYKKFMDSRREGTPN